MDIIKSLLKEIDEQQDIINAETESAEQGHSGARARIIEAEEKQDHLQERIDALSLWFALNKI
jgi:hypothetical protein